MLQLICRLTYCHLDATNSRTYATATRVNLATFRILYHTVCCIYEGAATPQRCSLRNEYSSRFSLMQDSIGKLGTGAVQIVFRSSSWEPSLPPQLRLKRSALHKRLRKRMCKYCVIMIIIGKNWCGKRSDSQGCSYQRSWLTNLGGYTRLVMETLPRCVGSS